MPRKTSSATGFGDRLLKLRRERGLTQVQLAAAIGTTQSAISHYEKVASYPAAPMIIKLSKALGVSIDVLLGVKKAAPATAFRLEPEPARLWKKFRRVQDLPERDQRAIMRMINSLIAVHETIHVQPRRHING